MTCKLPFIIKLPVDHDATLHMPCMAWQAVLEVNCSNQGPPWGNLGTDVAQQHATDIYKVLFSGQLKRTKSACGNDQMTV